MGEHGKDSKDHNSETRKVVDKESKSTQFANPADQVRSQLKDVLEKPNKGLTKPVQQVTKENIPKDPLSEQVVKEMKNVDVRRSNDTLITEFTSKLDKETQKFPLKSVGQKEMSEQTRERLLKDGLLKDSSNDSGYSSPTHTDHSKSQINFMQLEEKLNEHVKQSDLTPFKELAQRLNQKNYGLKQVDSKTRYISPQTRKHLIEDGLLKDNSNENWANRVPKKDEGISL